MRFAVPRRLPIGLPDWPGLNEPGVGARCIRLIVAGIALIPAFVIGKALGNTGGGQQLSFFGISILIAVGVALETVKQVDGQLMMRNYEGFLDTTKAKAKARSKSGK